MRGVGTTHKVESERDLKLAIAANKEYKLKRQKQTPSLWWMENSNEEKN